MAELNLDAVNYYANTATDISITDFALSPQERSALEQAGRLPSSGGEAPETGGAPRPTNVSLSQFKSRLNSPALTAHYQCWFNPPQLFREWLGYKDIGYVGNEELISLSCSEAVLPGSSMMTNEINDDFTGVTERHAYRRQYDDRADFTFYVNTDGGSKNYYIIRFFEYWLSYICGEEYSGGLIAPNYSYRIRYPTQYQSPALNVHKFERDHSGKYLQYRLLQAYPISISSMPVSYESSQLLKCTVSFTYTRYLLQTFDLPTVSTAPPEGEPVPNPDSALQQYANTYNSGIVVNPSSPTGVLDSQGRPLILT